MRKGRNSIHEMSPPAVESHRLQNARCLEGNHEECVSPDFYEEDSEDFAGFTIRIMTRGHVMSR
eukprot:m.21880 g.21880  ORF g.21880 m.21880 type:complete len:64 (-) comp10577_c0_seq2:212-403(-)